MTPRLEHLVVGPDRHGIVRFATDLDIALGTVGFETTLRRTVGEPGDVGIHVQFTDHLFGRSATDAAAEIGRLAARSHERGRRLTITLHDLPQPSDGTHFAERARAYAAVCAACDAVVVSSEHERNLLADIGVDTERVTVIPLPVPARRAPPATTTSQPPSVGVFGYLYPGKGHLEVLTAMRDLPRSVWMLAVGEPSVGHHDLIDALSETARGAGRRFAITGHVPDGALTGVLHAITVPVAHHRHVSASASLNAWLSAGRRPLAPATRYTSEVAERNPDALLLYPDGDEGLRTAIADALADPASTWLPPGLTCVPTAQGAAQLYADALTGWHR